MKIQTLPEEIEEIVGGMAYALDEIGKSGSEVRIYDRHVIKIQPRSGETDQEAAIAAWVGRRLPVPEILAYRVRDGMAFTLMSRAIGIMLCDPEYMRHPEKVIDIVARSMKMMWTIDTAGCVCRESLLSERLKVAEYNVSHGLVDVDDAEPETFGPDGFRNPAELLTWLKENRPPEDIVLTHGDLCLPNIFADGNEITGLIDLGKMGPADRWQDIAIAIRSLKSNFYGAYSNPLYRYDFRPEMLLRALGVEMDEAKYRYYFLLDELF